MLDIIVRAGCFVAIILLGFTLKKIGFFKQEDFTLLSRITLRITLPAAIIAGFGGKQFDRELMLLPALGLGCGILYLFLGFVMNRKQSRERQSFEMLNLAGYNIGTFVLPFAQSFLGPIGVITASFFDTGNALICQGGSYSIACMVKDGAGFSARRLGKSLVTSVPFMTYVLMMVMNLSQIPVPGFVMALAEDIGNANAFMAMLTIGVGFRLGSGATGLGTVARILGVRYGVGILLSCLFFFCLPFDLEVRQTLVILCLSPIGSAIPAFTEEMKADSGLSSAINSMSILISIVITVAMLTVML